MPNWMKNLVVIDATKETIEKIKKTVTGEERLFDFNKIIPMPEPLSGVEDGGRTDYAVIYYLTERLTKPVMDVIQEAYPATSPYIISNYRTEYIHKLYMDLLKDENCCPYKDEELYNLGKQVVENVKNTGYRTWYDWRLSKWGCKWNASDVSIYYEDDKSIIYRFETPWNEPNHVVIVLSKMYPDAKIKHYYSSETDSYSTTQFCEYKDGEYCEYEPFFDYEEE